MTNTTKYNVVIFFEHVYVITFSTETVSSISDTPKATWYDKIIVCKQQFLIIDTY